MNSIHASLSKPASRCLRAAAIVVALSTVTVGLAWSQTEPGSSAVADYATRTVRINRTGMTVLGAWALGNFLVSGFLATQTEGEWRNFHLMNVGWNVVNAGIAVGGYLGAASTDPAGISAVQALRQQGTIEKALLFNAGLDVGYVMTGFFLRERAKTSEKADMLRGIGTSLILQGAFLFAFDVVLAVIQTQHGWNMDAFVP
jgi:hypothetical protein